MRFAFLVYVPRSGSTLLARNLGARCPELVVPPEFHLLEVLIAEGDAAVRQLPAGRLLELMRLDRQIEALGLAAEELEAAAAEAAGRGIRALLEALITRYLARRAPEPGATPATTAFLKLGTIVYVADELLRVFPEAKFVHVYRDPRAVTNSLVHNTRPYFAGKMGRGDPIYVAREYARIIKAVRELAARAPVLDVQYERFCTDPDAELAPIARFLGVELSREAAAPAFEVAGVEHAIHRLVDRPPAPERTSAWRDELAGWAGLAVEDILRDLMAELGYEPHFARAVPPMRARVWLARARIWHVRSTAQHYARRLAYYRNRPAWLRNRLKLILRRRGRI